MYNVLIVDDEEDILSGIKKIVSDMNVFSKIDVCSDPFEAEKMLISGGYDLLITDICMDGETGFDMIKNAGKAVSKTKKVILTAYYDFEFMHTAIKAGVDDYVLKPINKSAFVSCLNKMKAELDEHAKSERLSAFYGGNVPDAEKIEYVGKLQNALDYIDAHFTEKLNLAYVANLVDQNYFYFSRNFKREVGMTFLEYVTEKRMTEAVKLLSDNNLKIYEISEKLGYDDCKYFFKLFKKRYGISPTALRSQNDKRKNTPKNKFLNIEEIEQSEFEPLDESDE